MMRLLKYGLIYGDLFKVDTPAMVERYNVALEALTGRRTELDNFMIDISGFAPEIGDEFDDEHYLNPHGVNRQFILLSTAQKECPLLNAKFSTSHHILKSFIEDNESQLFALTARDAVAGELNNSVLRADKAAKLFDIRQIVIEADTSKAHLKDAAKLQSKIEEFQTREDAWWDDVLIAQMITLSKRTGDVTQNPIMFSRVHYEQGNFFTEHFGGVYVFRDMDVPAAIARRPKADLGEMPIQNVLDFGDRRAILSFLSSNSLVESITEARGLDVSALLRQRLDFILVSGAAEAGEDLSGVTRQQLRVLHRKHLRGMPEEYHALSDILRWVEQGGRRPSLNAEHPAAFYTLRATQTPDKDLVNMLLAELCPLDVRQLHICHKQAFYDAYMTWPEAKRAYVAEFLAREYMGDKAGAREALFGGAPLDAGETLAGPWGEYKR